MYFIALLLQLCFVWPKDDHTLQAILAYIYVYIKVFKNMTKEKKNIGDKEVIIETTQFAGAPRNNKMAS